MKFDLHEINKNEYEKQTHIQNENENVKKAGSERHNIKKTVELWL